MIKVQGNRIYLSEVAAEAEALPEVLEAHALAIPNDAEFEIFLFAIAASANSALDEIILRKRLSSRLPSYMLPRYVEVLECFPRTANGKPDRQKLMARVARYQEKRT
jgi:acyl-CoA synthetase (AMP-forming)/AMP-acid ligase II